MEIITALAKIIKVFSTKIIITVLKVCTRTRLKE